MSYDPRTTALADALFDERSGKTVRIVADDAARDALNPSGPMIAVTEHDDLINIYDTEDSVWVKRGEKGAVKVDTPEDLLTIEEPQSGDIAVVRASSTLYCFDGTEWVLCGGGGGGLKKVDTFNDLLSLEGLEDGDTAIVVTTNELYAYDLPTDKWTLVVTGTREVAGGASWQLVKKFSIENEILDKVIESLSPGVYRLTLTKNGADSINGNNGINIRPNSEVTGYRKAQRSILGDNNVYSLEYTTDHFNTIDPSWDADYVAAAIVVEITIGVDSTVCRVETVVDDHKPNDRALSYTNYCVWNGEATSLQVYTDGPATCEVSLSKWEDVYMTELHSYELVEAMVWDNETTQYDVDIDPESNYHYVYNLQTITTTQSTTLRMYVNDVTADVYVRNYCYNGVADVTSTEPYYNMTFGGRSLIGSGDIFPKGQGEGAQQRALLQSRNTRRNVSGARHEYLHSLFMTPSNMDNANGDIVKISILPTDAAIGRLDLYRVAESRLLDNGFAKVTTQAQLANEQVYDGKLALTLDTKVLYVYKADLGLWEEFSSGGGGIEKVATKAALPTDPANADMVITESGKELLTFDAKSGEWVYPVTGTKDVAAGGNWNFVEKQAFPNEAFDFDAQNLEPGLYKLEGFTKTPIYGDELRLRFNGDVATARYYGHFAHLNANGYSATSMNQAAARLCHDSFGTAYAATFSAIIDARNPDNVVVTTEYNRDLSTHVVVANALGVVGDVRWKGTGFNSIQLDSSGNPLDGELTLYKFEEIRATELHSYELIKEATFNSEVFSFDIDTRDIKDEPLYVEISGYFDTGSSLVVGRFDDDAANNYEYNTVYNHSSALGSGSMQDRVYFGNGSTQSTATAKISKIGDDGYTFVEVREGRTYTSSYFGVSLITSIWKNITTPQKLSLFDPNNAPYTGSIKVYRLAKSHLLDTAINKVANEEALLDAPYWDGRIAMTLDTKQIYVYDGEKSAWVGKSGVKTAKGFTVKQIVVEYDHNDLNDGVSLVIPDGVDRLYYEYANTGSSDNVKMLVDGRTSGYRRAYSYPIAGNTTGWYTGSDDEMLIGFSVEGTLSEGFIAIMDNQVFLRDQATQARHATQAYFYNSYASINLTERPKRLDFIRRPNGSEVFPEGSYLRIYKETSLELPDMVSAEANLYGWKLRGKGEINTAERAAIPITGDPDLVKIVARSGGTGDTSSLRVSVNNDFSNTYENTAFYVRPAATTSAVHETNSGFCLSNPSAGGGERAAPVCELRKTGAGIESWATSARTYPGVAHYTNVCGGSKEGISVIETVNVWSVENDAAATIEYEVYEWGPIEIPVVGGGDGTTGQGIEKVASELALPSAPEHGDMVITEDNLKMLTYDAADEDWVMPKVDEQLVAGGNWMEYFTARFTGQKLDLDITEGEYLIRVHSRDGCNTFSADDFIFTFDDVVSGNAYTGTAMWANTSAAAASVQQYNKAPVAPPSWVTRDIFDIEMRMSIRNGKAYIHATHRRDDGYTSHSSYFYAGNPQTMQFLSFNGRTGLDADIEIHRWDNVVATEMHSMQLIKEKQLSNDVIDITFDIGPDDHIVIEGFVAGTDMSGGTTTYPNVGFQFNGDATSNYNYRTIYGSSSGAGSNGGTHTCGYIAYPNKVSKMASFKTEFTNRNISGERLPVLTNMTYDDAGDLRTYQVTSWWNNTIDTATSMRITSEGGKHDGIVRIYKVAKTHMVDTNINKFATETDLLTAPVWDGKLAMTLDDKQMWVYDGGKEAWLGKSGVKSQANVEGRVLIGEYGAAELNAGFDINVEDIDSLTVESYTVGAGNNHVRAYVDDDTDNVYEYGQINSTSNSVYGSANNISWLYLSGRQSWSTAEIRIFDDAVHSYMQGGYNDPEYAIQISGKYASSTRAKKLTIHNDVDAAEGTVVKIYQNKKIVIPDFASAMPNLYGWQKLAEGDTIVDSVDVPIGTGYERYMVVAKSVEQGALRTFKPRVNGVTADYRNSHVYCSAASNTTNALRANNSGFHGIPAGFATTHENNSIKMELYADGERVHAIGQGMSWNTGNSYPNTINYGGYLTGNGQINSLQIAGTDTETNVHYEVYGWGQIEIPVAVNIDGGGKGLETAEVNADQQLSVSTYHIVDSSAGPVVLTMPETVAVGDELVVLDAMRTFGLEGTECTLNPGTNMVEGSTAAVDLNATGEEYKFKFVGGSMGWRMI